MAIYIAATYDKRYRYAEYVPEDKTSGTCSDLQIIPSYQKTLERYGSLFPGQFCVFYENDQLTFVASANCMVSISENQEGKYFAGYIDENANTAMPFNLKYTYPFKKDVLSSLDAEYPKGLAYSQNVDRGVDFIVVAKVVDHLLTHKVTLIYGKNIEDAVKIMRASLLALPIKIANRGYFCTALNTGRFFDYIKDINTEENKNEIQSATTPFFVGCITGDIADHFKLAEYIINIDAIGSEVDCETSYAKYILKYRRVPYSTVQRAPYNSIDTIAKFNMKITSLDLVQRFKEVYNEINKFSDEELHRCFTADNVLLNLFSDYELADRQGREEAKAWYIKIATRLFFSKKIIGMSLKIKNYLFDKKTPFDNLLDGSELESYQADSTAYFARRIGGVLSLTPNRRQEDVNYLTSIFDLVTDDKVTLYYEKAIISFFMGNGTEEEMDVLKYFISSLDENKLNVYAKLSENVSDSIGSCIAEAIANQLADESKRKRWIDIVKRDHIGSSTKSDIGNRDRLLQRALEIYLDNNKFWDEIWQPSQVMSICDSLADAIQYQSPRFTERRKEIDDKLSLEGARRYFTTFTSTTQDFPVLKQKKSRCKKEIVDSFPFGIIIPLILFMAGIIIYACTEGTPFELIGTILFGLPSNLSRALLIEIPVLISVIACAGICITEREEDYTNRIKRVLLRELSAVGLVVLFYVVAVVVVCIKTGLLAI